MDKKTIKAIKLFRKNLAEDLRKELEECMKIAGQSLADNRDKDIYDIIKKDMAGYCAEIEDNLVTYEEIFKE